MRVSRGVADKLIWAGGAAVLAVYMTGYIHTEREAERFAHQVARRRAFGEAPTSNWKDGTFTGWGFSPHGNLEASVVVERGRIASAIISQCRTRYSCSVIEKLPPEVAQRQSPNVDYVSGATQSADAFYGAVVAALNKAK